jgi:hypothetical protein
MKGFDATFFKSGKVAMDNIDRHSDIVVLFVKRAIVKNLTQPGITASIKKGGGVLWNNYYRYAMYHIEKVSSVKKRLAFDIENTPFTQDIMYLKEYLATFDVYGTIYT